MVYLSKLLRRKYIYTHTYNYISRICPLLIICVITTLAQVPMTPHLTAAAAS